MSDSAEYVLCRIDDHGIAHVTLNRPKKHNAFNAEVIESLTECFHGIEKTPHVRALWLKSSSKHFCAGADLKWMQSSAHFSEEENRIDALKLGEMMHALYHLKIPTLATISGACFGGGIGLASCCKIAIASTEAKFCFSESKLGIVPAVISPYIVAALGHRTAQALFLTAEVFDAQKAYEWGLCYNVVEKSQLENRSKEILQAFLKGSPQALQGIPRLLASIHQKPLDSEMIEHTAQIIAHYRVSKEGQEGLTAFLEKRQPNWSLDI